MTYCLLPGLRLYVDRGVGKGYGETYGRPDGNGFGDGYVYGTGQAYNWRILNPTRKGPDALAENRA